MAEECLINSITNPSSTSSFVNGDTVNVTWTNNGFCNNWNVSTIVLQTSYPVGNWSNVSTLFNGIDSVPSNSRSVTLPSTTLPTGDYYRLKVTYASEGLEE